MFARFSPLLSRYRRRLWQLQPIVSGGLCRQFCDKMQTVVLDTVYRSSDEEHLLFHCVAGKYSVNPQSSITTLLKSCDPGKLFENHLNPRTLSIVGKHFKTVYDKYLSYGNH